MAHDLGITSVKGISVGNAHDLSARTGCTVILLGKGAEAACDARGGWPGTYDTESIGVTKRFTKKHAVFLTGGDVFGFDVAIGVRKYLIEQGIASGIGAGLLPGIVGADIYDLDFSDITKADYPRLGYQACHNATSGRIEEGNVGAGMGATVGKLLDGELACKGGLGTSCAAFDDVRVGAIMVTNSFGNIHDYENGKILAGCRNTDGLGFLEFEQTLRDYLQFHDKPKGTTIGLVATDAALAHEDLIKIAQMAHNGLAMSIRPTHTSTDGDTIFAVSTQAATTQERNLNLVDIIGHLAATQVANAVRRSVLSAQTLNQVPACKEVAW